MRQNRVRIWIDRHITSRITEFFLTDWRQAFRPLSLSTMHRGLLAAGPATGQGGTGRW